MLQNLGMTEILVFGGIIVLLFGAKRLPQLGRSLGQGINDFYRGLTGRLNDEGPKTIEGESRPQLPSHDADTSKRSAQQSERDLYHNDANR
jgi:sec-independent protein translocase protein TatA